jgi:hypothetical protein
MSSTAQPTFPNGVWPTMITPFTADNKIDYPAMEKMIDWYMQRQVDGLFAVCQVCQRTDTVTYSGDRVRSYF